MTVDEYLALAGPSDFLRHLVTQTIQTAVDGAIDKFEVDKAKRNLILANMVLAMESAMIRNALDCTALAWRELAAPVRLRQKEEEDDERRRRDDERKRRDAEYRKKREKQREEEVNQEKQELKLREKRRRLQEEMATLTCVWRGFPYDTQWTDVETLNDIPWAMALLHELGIEYPE